MKNYRYASRYQPRFKPRYQSKFDVFVSDYASSVEEWKRAQVAPKSELPELTEQQKEIARKFGITEEEYARGVLAGRYGNERMQKKARALGEYAEQILGELGKGYKLVAIIWEGPKLRWMLRIETPSGVFGVPVPFEVADDAVDSAVLREIERLREIILAGVGQSAKTLKRSPR